LIERNPSQTAHSAAMFRAAHQLIDADPKILDDTVILRLLDKSVIDEIRDHPERLNTPRLRALRTHILVRSRFAEDRLALAASQGIDQYVILGAGLDTFAYRQPNWANNLHIFEVDQPASQREKRKRLELAGIAPLGNLIYVAVDFETDSLLDTLQHFEFNPLKPAFFSWLGVMVYLRQDAIESVFQAVASLPHSSEIVFTFSAQGQAQKHGTRSSITKVLAESLGEPWLSQFEPEAINQMLHKMGFSDVSFLTPGEIDQRYINGRQDGLFAMQRINTAVAQV